MWYSTVFMLVFISELLRPRAMGFDLQSESVFPGNVVLENKPSFPRIPPRWPYHPHPLFNGGPDSFENEHRYPVVHAGLPRALTVSPLPRNLGDHELLFNVSWLPSLGPGATDYSLEVISKTETEDCKLPICYEYDIPGNSTWSIIPKLNIGVSETCAIRPGCAYAVRLTPHPWDGHTSANKIIKLKECEAGVCSCAHAPRLPTPVVHAQVLLAEGQVKANISWTLPPPKYPRRLPPNLMKQYYFVSIGKQMVSDAHPSPWFAHSVSRHVMVDGPVALGDDVRWTIVEIDERSGGQSGDRQQKDALEVKLLARVSLVDERGCVGPAGNATAYDPADTHKVRIGTYLLWAALGGTCVLTMVAIIAVSTRVVKRVLNTFRPAPVSAPLEPLCRRPAWLPMQLRTSEYEYKGSASNFLESDDEHQDKSSSKTKTKGALKRAPSYIAESDDERERQQGSSSSKKTKTAPKRASKTSASQAARGKPASGATEWLFGSDTEEEVPRKVNDSNTCVLTRRVPGGTVRRTANNIKGDLMVELRLYNHSEVCKLEGLERCEKAIVWLRLRGDGDSTEFTLLKKFLTKAKEKFNEEATFFAEKKKK